MDEAVALPAPTDVVGGRLPLETPLLIWSTMALTAFIWGPVFLA